MNKFLVFTAAMLISVSASAATPTDKSRIIYSKNPETKPAPLDEYLAADPFVKYEKAYKDNANGQAAPAPKRNIFVSDEPIDDNDVFETDREGNIVINDQ